VWERGYRGPFASLADFLRRTPASIRRPAVENLVWVGGFETMGLTRRELLWQTGLWLGPESDAARTSTRGDHAQRELPLDDPYAGVRFDDLDDADRMIAEYRMLKFSTSLHPLELLGGQLPRDRVTAGRLPNLPQRSKVCVAGMVTARQRPSTAKGYVFVLMEDEDGPINAIVKPKIYERDRNQVRAEPFVVVRGTLQKDGKTINVIADSIRAIRPDSETCGKLFHTTHLPGTTEWWSDRARGDAAALADGPEAPDTPHGLHPNGTPRRDGSMSATERRPGADAAGTRGGLRTASDPFSYLTALRQHAPDTRSWG